MSWHPIPAIAAWMDRVRAFGNGTAAPLSPQEALRVATEATPMLRRASEPFFESPPLGSRISIRADDCGRDLVEGELVLIDGEGIALRRVDP